MVAYPYVRLDARGGLGRCFSVAQRTSHQLGLNSGFPFWEGQGELRVGVRVALNNPVSGRFGEGRWTVALWGMRSAFPRVSPNPSA